MKISPINVSKAEQRVLHVLAQGGHIKHEFADEGAGTLRQARGERKSGKGRIVAATCYTRDGYVLSDCSLGVFRKLKRRRLIASRGGGPYRITRLGLAAVRPQLDNR